MQKRYCDRPGCGREIEQVSLAKQPLQVQIPGFSLMSVAVSFSGPKPDICNHCILDGISTLREKALAGVVVPLERKTN